jgi:cell division protein FtsB
VSTFRRVAWPFLVVATVLAILFYAVFPTRQYFEQRELASERLDRLAAIEAANAQLQERIDGLSTPAEIERLARRDFGLVYPGEEAYAVLPPAPEPVTLPDVWPFTTLADRLVG